MRKKLVFAAFAALSLGFTANAQVNLQVLYDTGRGYGTTTFEMFKGDSWGNTFFFIDHYFTSPGDRQSSDARSAINGSYFEVERCLNFWQNSKLGNLSIQVEYDGATWGSGVACIGANYFLHSKDFKNTFNLELLYDFHIGYGCASTPIKFTGVWGMQDLFGLSGLRFSGFIDVWGNNSTFIHSDGSVKNTKVSVLTEPQLWYNLGKCFKCENLHIGGEVELSYNFAGNEGFMCNPAVGLKWVF